MEKPNVPTVVLVVALVGLIAFSAVMIWRGLVSDPGARPEGGRHQQLRHWKCTKCGREFDLTASEHGLQTRDAEDFPGSRAQCPDQEKNGCGRWSAVFVPNKKEEPPPAEPGRGREGESPE